MLGHEQIAAAGHQPSSRQPTQPRPHEQPAHLGRAVIVVDRGQDGVLHHLAQGLGRLAQPPDAIGIERPVAAHAGEYAARAGHLAAVLAVDFHHQQDLGAGLALPRQGRGAGRQQSAQPFAAGRQIGHPEPGALRKRMEGLQVAGVGRADDDAGIDHGILRRMIEALRAYCA
jgi:hypothetical protein